MALFRNLRTGISSILFLFFHGNSIISNILFYKLNFPLHKIGKLVGYEYLVPVGGGGESCGQEKRSFDSK
jgi:hypothetical protein